jgi:pre-mRNA-processing factor 17
MSLALGYSSGEDEDPAMLAKDAFGISSIPTSKKSHFGESTYQLTAEAAPHVLAEVGSGSEFLA